MNFKKLKIKQKLKLHNNSDTQIHLYSPHHILLKVIHSLLMSFLGKELKQTERISRWRQFQRCYEVSIKRT